jgi:hypothetical protein
MNSSRCRAPLEFHIVNLNRFNEQQRKALLELLIMAMYCDARLASAEDLRIHKVADSLGFPSDDERRTFLESLFSTISRLPRSGESLRPHLAIIARRFPTGAVRTEAFNAVEELLQSDHRVAPQESQFMVLLKEIFNA